MRVGVADTALPQASPELEAVLESDRRFFRRFPGRSHRLRLMARAEIESGTRAGFEFGPPQTGFCWAAVMRQVAPGVRFKAFLQIRDDLDTDAPEGVCRDLYETFCPAEMREAEAKAAEIVRGRA